jgi:hypothetical protein
MLQNGRPADPLFDPNEALFFRWSKTDLTDDNQIRPENMRIFRVPDQSVNRSKHNGRDWHVLLPNPEYPNSPAWLCMGVFRISVSDVPAPVTRSGAVHELRVEHAPDKLNFEHCELRVYKNGVREQSRKKVPDAVKKEFRTAVFQAAELVIVPDDHPDKEARPDEQSSG